MPPTDQQPVQPAQARAKRPWFSWILVWLFGAAVGAGLVLWLVPQKDTTPTDNPTHKASVSPSPSASPSPVAKTVIKADAAAPAAGSCLGATGVATVTLNPDIPSPRCVQLSSAQTWKYLNQTGQTVTVYDGDAAVTIPNGQTGSFDFTKFSFGPGVHTEKVFVGTTAFYGGSGPEIWVK